MESISKTKGNIVTERFTPVEIQFVNIDNERKLPHQKPSTQTFRISCMILNHLFRALMKVRISPVKITSKPIIFLTETISDFSFFGCRDAAYCTVRLKVRIIDFEG